MTTDTLETWLAFRDGETAALHVETRECEECGIGDDEAELAYEPLETGYQLCLCPACAEKRDRRGA